MGDVAKGAFHRGLVAGRVVDDVIAFAVGGRGNRLHHAVVRRDGARGDAVLHREGEALGIAVQDGDVAADDAGEERCAESDRSGADDQRAHSAPDLRAGDRMGADRQELAARRLIDRERAGRIDIAFGDADPLAHAAVAMHAEHGDLHAAIRLAVAAGDAASTGDIGIDHHRLADFERAVLRRLQHHAGELMPDDPWVLQERVLAFVCGSRCRRSRCG